MRRGALGGRTFALLFTGQAISALGDRVSSWDYLGSLVLQLVGQAASGPVAVAIGVSATLYAAGGLFVILLLAVLAVPAVRNYRSGEPRPGAE